jgi:hypothetical protein
MKFSIVITVFALILTSVAVADTQYVSVNRKIEDIVMSVSFQMPSGAQTQAIRCPGSLMKLQALNNLSSDIGFRDNKSRLGVIRMSTGALEFSDVVKANFRRDPISDFYVFRGSPGTWLTLECGPYSNADNPEETYSEQFFESYREGVDAPTACHRSRIEDNKAYFKCGHGFVQPYGCTVLHEERRKICYDIKNGEISLWDSITPGILEHYKTVVDHYANDARMREFVDKANALAAQGDPFFEVSTAANAAAEAEALAQEQAESAALAQEAEEQARYAARAASQQYERTAPQLYTQPAHLSFNPIVFFMWAIGILTSMGVVLRYNGTF